MDPIQQAGNYRGRIVGYGLFEAESGAVAINIRGSIDEVWHESQWADYSEYDLYADGAVWIIKKDGSIHQKAVENLIRATGWDGSLPSIQNQDWDPRPCAFVINPDEYNGETRFKIAFINEYDSTPGGMGQVDDKKLSELESRFGSSLRALAGNAKRNNKSETKDKPSKPAPAENLEPAGVGAVESGDNIPF